MGAKLTASANKNRGERLSQHMFTRSLSLLYWVAEIEKSLALLRPNIMSTSSANPPVAESPTEQQEAGQSESVPVLTLENGRDKEFKAGKWELMILGTMALLNIILAVDATVLPPALPVSTISVLFSPVGRS